MYLLRQAKRTRQFSLIKAFLFSYLGFVETHRKQALYDHLKKKTDIIYILTNVATTQND